MFNRVFTGIYRYVSTYNRWLAAGIVLTVTLSAARLPFIDFDNNIERLLPSRPEISRSIRFFREAGLSDKVVLSVSLKQPGGRSGALTAAVSALAEDLRGAYITDVITGVPRGDPGRELRVFMTFVPQLLGTGEVQTLRREVTPAWIDRQLASTYRQLVLGDSMIMRDLLRMDPLGFAGGLLGQWRSEALSSGYRVQTEQGFLLSEDRKHALLILTTPVSITDGFGARKLLEHIDTCVNRAVHPLMAIVMAGHRHTLSNEAVIRRDVRLICVFSSLGFLFLFVAVFRDWRSAGILFMPLAAVVLSISLSSLCLGSLSYFIAGMSAVLIGIAVDYAIHVYVGVRTGGEKTMEELARPVTVGALTTMSVFFAFFFSSVPGYRQLACFSLIGLTVCLLMSLFLLPRMIKPGTLRGVDADRSGTPPVPGWPYLRIGGWVFLLCVFAGASLSLEFETDVTRFDSSDRSILEGEARFYEIWGGEDRPGILVVEGRTEDAVLRMNDAVTVRARECMAPEQLSSLTAFWPSSPTRRSSAEAWRTFWNEKGAMIRQQIASARDSYGFAEDAFEPFLTWAEAGAVEDKATSMMLDRVRERFLRRNGDVVRALIFFRDTKENVRQLSTLTDAYGPSVYLVSRQALAEAISRTVSRETIRLSLIAAVLIALVLLALVRDIRLAALALIPVGTGIVAVLGVLSILGMSINAASMVALMIVVGLCIDYGIFVVYAERHRTSCGTLLSVKLSVATTLVGAGALLLARHAVMFTIGVTLVTGVLAGALSALWVVPVLHNMSTRRSKE